LFLTGLPVSFYLFWASQIYTKYYFAKKNHDSTKLAEKFTAFYCLNHWVWLFLDWIKGIKQKKATEVPFFAIFLS